MNPDKEATLKLNEIYFSAELEPVSSKLMFRTIPQGSTSALRYRFLFLFLS